MGTTAINLSQEVPGKNIKEYLFDAGSLEKIPNGLSVNNLEYGNMGGKFSRDR